MAVLKYLPLLGLGFLFSIRSSAQQMKLGLQPTQIKKDALLELNSDSQGLLLNRVPKSAVTAGGALFGAADGMLVYVTDASERCLYIKADGTWKKVADYSSSLPANTTLSLQAGTGMKASTTITKNLNTNPTFTIDADKDAAIWNAEKIASVSVATTAPSNNDVLTFTGTRWEPKAPAAAGNAYILNGTALQTGNFNITGYADVGTAVRVGGDVQAGGKIGGSTGAFSANVAVGSLTVNNLAQGSVLFMDASKNVTQNNSQFFWDNNKATLGLGTTTPVNKLEVAGPANGLTVPAYTSGLRLTNLVGATPATAATANNKVLSINATGDVILADNSATSIWTFTGNSNVDSTRHFLGTTNNQALILKYNNQELFRGTHGMGGFTAMAISLFNGAKPFNGHPFIVRANGNDVMAFQDATGLTKWHWNLLGNGLNFVETANGIDAGGDYRLFLKAGGNVGVGTNDPQAKLDVNGTAKIGTDGSVLTGIYRAVNQTVYIGRNVTATGTGITFTVTGARIGGNVIINPRGFNFVNNTINIISSRVTGDDEVTVYFYNSAAGNRSFDITVIQ